MENHKPNVALIIPGGVGTGNINIGVPVLERIIQLLALEYNVTVFQLYPTNRGYQVNGYTLVDVYSAYPVIKFIKCLLVFSKYHYRNRFEIVHGFWALPGGLFAVLLGKIFGIRSVVSILGGDTVSLPQFQYGQLRTPLYRFLVRSVIVKADIVISLTRYLVDNLKKFNIEREDVKIIPWGIDTSLFTYRIREITSTVQFLHIANFHPVKDQGTLLQAFKIISEEIEAQLTIIGEGADESYIKSLIDEFKLQSKVQMIGLQPYEELPHYYGRADILLHTSVSEGQSEVVTEAMSCGVVVCGTNVGILYDLPECCISVPIKDYKSLAKKTLVLLRDQKQMNDQRTNAYEWASEHSIKWTVEKIKNVYF